MTSSAFRFPVQEGGDVDVDVGRVGGRNIWLAQWNLSKCSSSSFDLTLTSTL